MPYDSTTKKVEAKTVNGVLYGVTWRDVQQALGVTDTDEHALCQSGRVRMLSRYKPIKDTLNGQARKKAALSSDDFMLRNWGFRIPEFPGSDLDAKAKAIVKGGAVWGTYTDATLEAANIGNGWVYPKPVKDVNFARISDFNGYDGSKPNNYQHKTLVITNEYATIGSVEKITNNVQISFDMSPYSPRNFKSLEDHCLAVAFWYQPDDSEYESDTYYYVGPVSEHNITIVSLSAAPMTLIIPVDVFKALLNKAVNGSQHARKATFYAVGFFAPKQYGGYNNITGSWQTGSLSGLKPLPGLGYDTFRLGIVGGSGDYDVCLLAITGIATTVPQSGSKVGFTAKIMSVTNNYDLISTDTGGVISFIPAYLQYTYDVYNVKGARDETLSQDTRRDFGNNTGIIIDVSNTEKTDGVVTHKTTDVSGNDITANIPVFQDGALAGYTVVVKLWYLTYNSTANDRIYHMAGQFVVTVNGELSRDA